MTLISCDMMAEQIRNEKHACTSTVEPCEGKAFVSSDDAYVDDNKTGLCTFEVGDSSGIPLLLDD